MSALPHRDRSAANPPLRRLEAQVALSWEQELELLTAAGLRDGMTIIDLGCGPGLVTGSLLARFPSSRVIAVESDGAMIELAASRLGEHPRLTLLEAPAEATGLPDGEADFVLARYLFQHLDEPQRVAAEALRILRPGGMCAVVDIDAEMLGIVTPRIPIVQGIFERGRRHQANRGGRPLIGRQLWRLLRDAGFEQPRLRSFTYHSDELGKEAFLPLLDVDQLEAAHAAGHISEAEMSIARAAVQHFLRDPAAFVLMLGLLATGRKGTAP
jgi:SAM-dependent methyltransferase